MSIVYIHINIYLTFDVSYSFISGKYMNVKPNILLKYTLQENHEIETNF